MTTTPTPIAQAVLLLRAAAQDLKDCHTRGDGDWAGEPEALAAHDEHIAAAEALEQYVRPQQCLHQISEPAAPAFPPMTPELESILGTICFQCIPYAQMLRAAGQQIKSHAEEEQAAVLHWMLSLWFMHGEDWRAAAFNEVTRLQGLAKELAAAKEDTP